jgi:hypothetical protein
MSLDIPEKRPSLAMEMDALNSILRVLEPLTHEQRVRCLGAAFAMFEPAVALLSALHGVARNAARSKQQEGGG